MIVVAGNEVSCGILRCLGTLRCYELMRTREDGLQWHFILLLRYPESLEGRSAMTSLLLAETEPRSPLCALQLASSSSPRATRDFACSTHFGASCSPGS